MNIVTGEAADEFFGGAVPAHVRPLLQQAGAAPPALAEALLWTAQACAPQCLTIYYLLYKLNARRRAFAAACKAAEGALAEAARQAGLPLDWRQVMPGSADFSRPGPARFWLFTLKALAFIALRSDRREEAELRLARLALLDPQDRVGAEVVAALTASARAGSAGL